MSPVDYVDKIIDANFEDTIVESALTKEQILSNASLITVGYHRAGLSLRAMGIGDMGPREVRMLESLMSFVICFIDHASDMEKLESLAA